jgi:RNA polymerase sigma factor (sigma-70 family)
MTQTKQKNWDAEAFTPGIKFKPNARKDNPTTIEEAFKQCTPMVHKLAKKWTRNHYQYYNDFVSEGFIGICEAWKRFDGTDFQSKGYRFSSYAFMWIRAIMKDFANRLWKNFNNTTEGTEYNMDTDYYEISIDSISVKRNYEKLSKRDQEVVRMKTEGFTFDDIANKLGFQNLHKARHRYLELCEQLGA